MHELGVRADRGQRRWLDLERQRRCKPDGANHPQGVLFEPGVWVAHGPETSPGRIRDAVVRVDEARWFARPRAPGHRIDRQVAPREIQLDRVTELHVMRSPEVRVVVIAPERGDLEHLATMANGDGPEPVLIERPGKELDDPFGLGVGREIPVGRATTEHDVAQGPTDDERRVTRGPEGLEQLARGGRDRPSDGGGRVRQLRPRNRYERHASLCSSAR